MKEKGFDWDVLHSYRDGKLDYEDYFRGTIDELYFNANGRNITKFKEIISAPTQSLLQRWLREVHNTIVEITWQMCSTGYEYAVIDMNNPPEYNDDIERITSFKTYEEALEEGLLEALKLIK